MKNMLAWMPKEYDSRDQAGLLAIWVEQGTVIKSQGEFLNLLSGQIQMLFNQEVEDQEGYLTADQIIKEWETMWIDRQLWEVHYQTPDKENVAHEMLAWNLTLIDQMALNFIINQEFPTKPILKSDPEAEEYLKSREYSGLLEWAGTFAHV